MIKKENILHTIEESIYYCDSCGKKIGNKDECHQSGIQLSMTYDSINCQDCVHKCYDYSDLDIKKIRMKLFDNFKPVNKEEDK